jgi:hypothetical protein
MAPDRDDRPGFPLGILAIAFELYLVAAALVAVANEEFIAPIALIFLLIDHTEFVAALVLIVCGVDWFVTPTKPRALLVAVAGAVGVFLVFGPVLAGLAQRM